MVTLQPTKTYPLLAPYSTENGETLTATVSHRGNKPAEDTSLGTVLTLKLHVDCGRNIIHVSTLIRSRGLLVVVRGAGDTIATQL